MLPDIPDSTQVVVVVSVFFFPIVGYMGAQFSRVQFWEAESSVRETLIVSRSRETPAQDF